MAIGTVPTAAPWERGGRLPSEPAPKLVVAQQRSFCRPVRIYARGWRSSALTAARGSGERHAGLDVHLHQARTWLRERVVEVGSQLFGPAGGTRRDPVALRGRRNVEVG